MTAKHYEQFPSGALVQDLRKAVFDLVAEADEHAGAWTVFDLLRFRGVVSEVRCVLNAINEEDRTQKPRPMGARGWPNNEAVNAAIEVIRDLMQRLYARWELDRRIADETDDSGGIGDHPPCVLNDDDRTALIKKMNALHRMLRGMGLDGGEPAPPIRETVTLLEELDAGEPLGGLAMPPEDEPRPAISQQQETPTKTRKKRDQGKFHAAYGAYIAHIVKMKDGETQDMPPGPTELARRVDCSKTTASHAIRKVKRLYKGIKKDDASARYTDHTTDEMDND